MSRRNLSKSDASDFERSNLEYVLDQAEKAADPTQYISVQEALQDEAVYQNVSTRDVTRVLFISRDESLLNPTQQTLDGYTNVADLFDEVHILILRQGIKAKTPVIRLSGNVWLYTATNSTWWLTPLAGRQLAIDQLVFADGFRPDLIVARDPFESALVAKLLGEAYHRPVQIHVLENYTKPEWQAQNKANRWRRHLVKFTLKKALSVRVSTHVLLDLISKNFKIPDLALLPRFNNYEALITTPSSMDLRQRYKPFVFVMLYIGKLGHQSMFYRALDAARFGLRNPHLGLIALGAGPAKSEFEKRADLLLVRKQVVFETNIKDVVPYLKSANVLMVPDTDADSEEVVLQGAAAGIPMVIARTPAREDIFVDGESALFCDPNNTDDFSLKLNIIMNDIPLRKHLVEGAQAMIKAKFHEDPEAYRLAYRSSIEQVLFVNSDPVPQAPVVKKETT